MMDRHFDYQGFYDAIAPVYATGQLLLPVWRHYTEAALPWLPHDGAILEIGPGPGVLLARIAQHHTLAVGLDLSPGMLQQAQAHLHRHGLSVQLVQGNATRIPLVGNTFDGIVITFAFSAIPNGGAAMAEIARILRPGGVLALVDAGYPSDGNLMGTSLARLWEQFGDFMRDEAQLMHAAGLTVVAQREFGAFNSIRLVVSRKGNGELH